MNFTLTGITLLILICYARAKGYGPGTGGSPGGRRSPDGVRGGQSGQPGFTSTSLGGANTGRSGESDMSNMYNVGYQAPDGQGGNQFKSEFADGSGAVRGSYGYTDAQGLYRVVDYIADQNGFRADIHTNEPGVGPESPADVNMYVEPPPAGIQEQYTNQAVYSGYTGVGGSGVLGGTIRGQEYAGQTAGLAGRLPGINSLLPGQTGVLPGQAGLLPGQVGVLPGQAGLLSGQARILPGQAGVFQGQAGLLPGQARILPGQNGVFQGQAGLLLGQARALPGQAGVFQGQVGLLPGQARILPGQAGVFQGQAGASPGQAGVFSGLAGRLPGQAGVLPGMYYGPGSITGGQVMIDPRTGRLLSNLQRGLGASYPSEGRLLGNVPGGIVPGYSNLGTVSGIIPGSISTYPGGRLTGNAPGSQVMGYPTIGGGVLAPGGSSGLFTGIPKSFTGKSVH